MVYAADIKKKQSTLAITQELAKEITQTFLNRAILPIPITLSSLDTKPQSPTPHSWPETMSRLKTLGEKRLDICLKGSGANYDLLASLLDRVRFFILHRKDLFNDVDPQLVVQSAIDFFDVASSTKQTAKELYNSATNFIEEGAGEELSELEEKDISLGKDFEHAARDIKYAQIYRKFFSDANPNYHERYWTYPEDVPTAYGDHLFVLGNTFTTAAIMEAETVENILGYVDLINRSKAPDTAWDETFKKMKIAFIREGRSSADKVPKLLTMAGDAYTTALRFTSY